MIHRLKHQPKLGMKRKKTFRNCDLVDHIVVQNQGEPSGATVLFSQFRQQQHKDFQILSVSLDQNHLAYAGIQSARQITFLVLSQRWFHALLVF